MLGGFDHCVGFTLLPQDDGQPFHVTSGDRGGATAWGITRATLSRWLGCPASMDDVKALTREEAQNIYRRWYWDTIGGDLLPAGIDLMVFDHGVVAGEAQSVMELQQVLHMTGDQIDGHVGPITLGLIAENKPLDVIACLEARQAMHYRMCADFPRFGDGWMDRLERRSKAAILMVTR